MEAASAGMLEVEAGRLASTRAQDPQLKSFAQKMVTEHTQNNQKLMSIAQAKGVTPPNSLDSKHQAMLDKLERAQGAQFDQQFAQLMEKSHEDTAQRFERAQSQVQDSQLKAYIQSTLPTLHEHHRMAQSLPGAKGSKQAMSEGGSSGSGSGGSSSSMGGSSGTSGSSSSGGTSGSGSSSGGSYGGSSSGGSSSGGSYGGSSSDSTSPNSTPPDTSTTPPPSTRP